MALTPHSPLPPERDAAHLPAGAEHSGLLSQVGPLAPGGAAAAALSCRWAEAHEGKTAQGAAQAPARPPAQWAYRPLPSLHFNGCTVQELRAAAWRGGRPSPLRRDGLALGPGPQLALLSRRDWNSRCPKWPEESLGAKNEGTKAVRSGTSGEAALGKDRGAGDTEAARGEGDRQRRGNQAGAPPYRGGGFGPGPVLQQHVDDVRVALLRRLVQRCVAILGRKKGKRSASPGVSSPWPPTRQQTPRPPHDLRTQAAGDQRSRVPGPVSLPLGVGDGLQ